MPGSSLRSVIEVSARMVPTDVVVGRYRRSRATARVTDSMGSGWLAAAASARWMEARFQATRPLPVAASPSSSTAEPVRPRELENARLIGDLLSVRTYWFSCVSGDALRDARAGLASGSRARTGKIDIALAV